MEKKLATNHAVQKRTAAIRYDKKAAPRTAKSRVLPEIALVVNPNSCSGLTGKNWESLHAKIKEILGDHLQVAFSRKQGDGTSLTRKLLKRGFKKIVAIGGDGTINEIANGFFEEPVGIYGNKESHTNKDGMIMPSRSSPQPINRDAIMGVVSSGTRNVTARSLGLPEGIAASCRIVSVGKPKTIDVISATVTNPVDRSTTNTRLFLNAAEIGVGAEIIDRSRKVRKVVNSRLISTVTSVIATVPSYRSNECEILLSSTRKKLVAKITMAIVANGKFIGGGFKSAPRASMFDGLLDVVVLKDSGSLKILDELVNMKSGNYAEDMNVFYGQSRKVSLRSKERDVMVTIDGEPVGILPATFEIIPKALSIQAQ